MSWTLCGLPFLCISAAQATTNNVDGRLCTNATSQVERSLKLPDGFLSAISRVETGRPDKSGKLVPWPWTINVDGQGYFYDSEQAVINAVKQFQSLGHKSIDVGCLQVNIMHHSDAFSSLEQAFDPYSNARYAGFFLQRMKNQTGSWPHAAAAYHSQIEEKGTPYLQKVLEQWAIPQTDLPKDTSANLYKAASQNQTNVQPSNMNSPLKFPKTMPTRSLNTPVASNSYAKGFRVLTPQQALENQNHDSVNTTSHEINHIGQENTAQNTHVQNNKSMPPRNPNFRPFKGYFHLAPAPIMNQRYKTTDGGRNLASYRRTTIHQMAPMPMQNVY